MAMRVERSGDAEPLGSAVGTVERQPRRYLYKLYPTPEQKRRQHVLRIMCGELYDGLLEFCEQEQRRTGRLPSVTTSAITSRNCVGNTPSGPSCPI